MIEIAFLADYPETIPILTDWFRAQWPDYYAGRSESDIAQDFVSEAKRDGIPLRLVALVDGELAGTVVLRDRAMNATPEYHPGLGGLFVAAKYRESGIGTALVRSCMDVAREQGFGRIYTATVTAGGIMARLGWEQVQVVSIGGEQQVIYYCEISWAKLS
jgi:predicted N-acetyltransferase YhbS